MSKREPTGESFNKLLLWLDPDPEKAGEKYEKIRIRMIRIFACQECCDAEDLADETINVVTSKIDWLIEHYEGEPALYFYGVAKNIYRERLKRKRRPPPPPPDPKPDEIETVCSFLDDCLDELTSADRDLILQYHEGEKRQKINNRKSMAANRNITLNALRLKAYHIHSRLKQCIEVRIRKA